MKSFLLCLSLIASFKVCNAQLQKGTWIVGGNGGFSSSNKNFDSRISPNSFTSSIIDMTISPNIGYFLGDKFVVGIKPSVSWYKENVNGAGGGYTNTKRYAIGPFLRYYFLDPEKEVNLIAETCYQYGIYNFSPMSGNIKTFFINVGPVIYFNSTVGLEFLIGYYNRSEEITDYSKTSLKGFQVNIGFQIHLQKF